MHMPPRNNVIQFTARLPSTRRLPVQRVTVTRLPVPPGVQAPSQLDPVRCSCSTITPSCHNQAQPPPLIDSFQPEVFGLDAPQGLYAMLLHWACEEEPDNFEQAFYARHFVDVDSMRFRLWASDYRRVMEAATLRTLARLDVDDFLRRHPVTLPESHWPPKPSVSADMPGTEVCVAQPQP
jgi:hypothetical protein